MAAISSGNNDLALDMNGDGQLDLADVDVWLDVAGTINIGSAYLVGDANLDGVVDVSDFSVWNSHKFTNATGWCVGDFNADGAVDVSDFNRWNGNRFQASGRAANGESSTDERDGDRFVTRDSVTFRWSIETSREDQANHESRYKRIDAVFRGDFDR